MYWYIKYPLIAILILALLGIIIIPLRSCVSISMSTSSSEEQATTAQSKQTNPGTNVPDGNGNAQVAVDVQDLEDRLEQASIQLENGNLEAARHIANAVLKDSRIVEFDSTWFAAADIINAVNYKFMNSTAPCAEKQRYMVKSGDSLQRIANTTVTSQEFLLRLNPAFKRESGDPVIHPGDALFYIPTAWRIRVVKHLYILVLYRDDVIYRYYNVGIGRENRTPVGSFVISGRQAHPSWTPPGKNIPFGDPENILGTHWLALKPIGNTDPATIGYGIHGTWDDDSIGTASSSGCVRMHNDDVHELYDVIPNPGQYCPPIFVSIEE